MSPTAIPSDHSAVLRPARSGIRAARPPVDLLRWSPGWALLLLLACTGCTRPSEGVAHHDLLFSARVTSTLDDPAYKTTFCSGETAWTLLLRGGEELVTPVDLGARPKLSLEGCIRLPEQGEARDAGSMEITVEAVDGSLAPITASYPLRRGWQPLEVDLAPLAGHAVRVRLSGDFAPRRELALRAAHVTHQTTRPARRGGPNVLLVSVDTLRASALGVYGGPWPTPNLDRFAAEAERFEDHWAGSSWTKPGHATMLTGQPTEVHGAEETTRPIRRFVKTLAERLREGGFTTAALVNDVPWLSPKYGFARGFDLYRAEPWYADQGVRAASNWLGEHRDRRFFLFLHTFEVHSDFKQLPYESPGMTPKLVETRHRVPDYGCRQGSCGSALLERIGARAIDPLPEEPAILAELYGASVTYVDAALGRLFDDLRNLGLWDDTLIVVTADHGEVLLEHQAVLHGLPWEPVLSVPLLIKWPKGARAGRVTPGPSSAVDLAPTLLAALELPTEGLPGKDLRNRPAAEPVLAGWAPTWKAIRVGSLKAVIRSNNPAASELYDLATDPGETTNLAASRPEDLERLRRMLVRRTRDDLAHAAQADDIFDQQVTLSDEERERLRSLGYVF
jgi:arylsulfatase